jgi:hypothetical protein
MPILALDTGVSVDCPERVFLQLAIAMTQTVEYAKTFIEGMA